MKIINPKQQLDGNKGKSKAPKIRRVTPIFINPKTSRIFGVADVYEIDLERLLKVDSKRPQAVTVAFQQKSIEGLETHLKELHSLSTEEKVIRWVGTKSLFDCPEFAKAILDTIGREEDWIVNIPIEDQLPPILEELDPEGVRSRIHLGFVYRFCGNWETSRAQLEKAKALKFRTYTILEYSTPETQPAKAALEELKDDLALSRLQLNISLRHQGSVDPNSLEHAAQDIFCIFRSQGVGQAGVSSISVKYTPLPTYRAWWIEQFGPTLDDPFPAFSKYFEKDCSDTVKADLVTLLKKVSGSLREKIESAYVLHQIRLLKQQPPEGVEGDGSNQAAKDEECFAGACKTVLKIGESEVYRLLRTGKFLHLLEEGGVSRDKWPVRESHVRHLVSSRLTPAEQVALWKKVEDRYQQNPMTAAQINHYIDAATGGNDVKPSKDEQLINRLATISAKVEKQFPNNAEAKAFLNACKRFTARLKDHREKKGDFSESDVSLTDQHRAVKAAPVPATEVLAHRKSKKEQLSISVTAKEKGSHRAGQKPDNGSQDATKPHPKITANPTGVDEKLLPSVKPLMAPPEKNGDDGQDEVTTPDLAMKSSAQEEDILGVSNPNDLF